MIYESSLHSQLLGTSCMQVMLLPKIPLPKKLSEKIARFSTQKIDPATGVDVLDKNRRNRQVNFIDSGLKVAKTRFQRFLRGRSVLFKQKCQIQEFHAHEMERGEVFKRYCG